MDNVVEFPKEEERQWICVCGCVTFYLNSNDTTECAYCGVIDSVGAWLPEEHRIVPWTEKHADGHTRNHIDFQIPDISRSIVAKTIKDDEDVFAVGLIFKDGRTRVWQSETVESEDQAKWLDRKLADIAVNLKNNQLKEGGND